MQNLKNNTEKPERSDAWHMIELLGLQNRRMFTALITVLVLWAATIGGFVWYLYQYDFVSYAVDSTEGDANFIGNDGDINNYGEYQSKVPET